VDGYYLMVKVENPERIRIYRCLRSLRRVSGGVEHDECLDIIRRNRHVKFIPGLSGVVVPHMVYERTTWAADPDDFPKLYAEGSQGMLGHVVVSVEILPFEDTDSWVKNPRFHQPHYFQEDKRRQSWYEAGNTALVDVRIEKVLEVIHSK